MVATIERCLEILGDGCCGNFGAKCCVTVTGSGFTETGGTAVITVVAAELGATDEGPNVPVGGLTVRDDPLPAVDVTTTVAEEGVVVCIGDGNGGTSAFVCANT